MADYISREAAVKIAEKYGLGNGSVLGRHTGLADCIAIEIEGLPAADVEPVRHGRWEGYTHSCYCGIDQCGDPIFREKPVYYCSNPKCRRKTVVKENFCPSCGAKMDLMDLEVENHG